MNKYLTIGLCSVALLSGCGSSSDGTENSFGVEYNGENSEYVLNEASSAGVAQSSEKAILALYSPGGASLNARVQNSVSNSEELMDIISGTLYSEAGTQDIPTTTTNGTCGGSLTVEGNYQSFSFDANSFCIEIDEYNVTVSGSAIYTTTENTINILYNQFFISSDDPSVGDAGVNGETELTFLESGFSMSINADVTSNGIEEPLTYTWECDDIDGCLFAATFKTPEGAIYKVENGKIVILGNSVDYDMDLYLPEFGKLSVSTEGLTFCPDGSIESGQILLNDEEDNKLDITYEQCGVEPTISFERKSVL